MKPTLKEACLRVWEYMVESEAKDYEEWCEDRGYNSKHVYGVKQSQHIFAALERLREYGVDKSKRGAK